MIELARQSGRARFVYVSAAIAAILAAILIWDASAGPTLPGAQVSNRAGATAW